MSAPIVIKFKLQQLSDSAFIATYLAKSLVAGVVFLNGDLGAGKTTLTSYWLKALGVEDHVKSPTYTLVESYQLPNKNIYHFDLYRLNDPFELELLGIRDYFSDETSLALIEWPDKGDGFLPLPDININLISDYQTNHRLLMVEWMPQHLQIAQKLMQSLLVDKQIAQDAEGFFYVRN